MAVGSVRYRHRTGTDSLVRQEAKDNGRLGVSSFRRVVRALERWQSARVSNWQARMASWRRGVVSACQYRQSPSVYTCKARSRGVRSTLRATWCTKSERSDLRQPRRRDGGLLSLAEWAVVQSLETAEPCASCVEGRLFAWPSLFRLMPRRRLFRARRSSIAGSRARSARRGLRDPGPRSRDVLRVSRLVVWRSSDGAGRTRLRRRWRGPGRGGRR
jgi:hypothetical protein